MAAIKILIRGPPFRSVQSVDSPQRGVGSFGKAPYPQQDRIRTPKRVCLGIGVKKIDRIFENEVIPFDRYVGPNGFVRSYFGSSMLAQAFWLEFFRGSGKLATAKDGLPFAWRLNNGRCRRAVCPLQKGPGRRLAAQEVIP